MKSKKDIKSDIFLPSEDYFRLCYLDPRMAGDVFEYYKKNEEHFTRYAPISECFLSSPNDTAMAMIKEFDLIISGWAERYFVIIKSDDGDEIAGDVSASGILHGFVKSANVGIRIDKSYTGRGLARRVLKVFIRHLRNDLLLRRIESDVAEKNISAQKLVHSLGFLQESVLKEYICINGIWTDHFRYVLINSDCK